MKTGLGVVLCIVLWSATGRADTFYQYRDKSTGRDVFVNRLDQIPRKYRDQAKIVIESADSPKPSVSDSPLPSRIRFSQLFDRRTRPALRTCAKPSQGRTCGRMGQPSPVRWWMQGSSGRVPAP